MGDTKKRLTKGERLHQSALEIWLGRKTKAELIEIVLQLRKEV